jgi:hypothetical protein
MMLIKITGWFGSSSEGLVLATFGSTIRVAIPGCDDAAEFTCRGGHWFSEDGEPVEIAFPAAQRLAVVALPGSDDASANDDRSLPARCFSSHRLSHSSTIQ